MVKRLSLWVTPTYASLDIETDDFTRATSGRSVENLITGLPTEDRAVLRAFLATMLQTLDQSKAIPAATATRR